MIQIKERLSLDYLGEEYKGSYLVFYAISVGEQEKFKDETVLDLVISKFVEGKIKQDGEFVDITPDNIKELPDKVLTKAFKVISGRLDPKLDGQS